MQDSSFEVYSLSLLPLDFGAVKLTYSCCACDDGPGHYLIIFFCSHAFYFLLFVYFFIFHFPELLRAEACNEFTLWGFEIE